VQKKNSSSVPGLLVTIEAKDLLNKSSDVKRLVCDWPKLVVKDSLMKQNVGKIS